MQLPSPPHMQDRKNSLFDVTEPEFKSSYLKQLAGRWRLATILLALCILLDTPWIVQGVWIVIPIRLAMSGACLATGWMALKARSRNRYEWVVAAGSIAVIAGFSALGSIEGIYYCYTIAICQLFVFMIIFLPVRTPLFTVMLCSAGLLWFGLFPWLLGQQNYTMDWFGYAAGYFTFGCMMVAGNYLFERLRNNEHERKINIVERARQLEERTEAMIRENSRKYEKLLKLSTEPTFLHDGETIQYANDAFLQLAGLTSSDEIRGVSVHAFKAADHTENEASQYEMTVKGESLKFQQYRFVKACGEVIEVEACSIAVNNHSEHPLFQTVLRDLTARKLVEEKLGRSDKLSALGQMAAGVAHEIRNPLTSLKGFVQLLRKKAPEYETYYDIMSAELERINMIVNDFMLIAKPKQSEFKLVQISEVLDHVYALLESQAYMNQIKLHKELEEELPPVLADGNQLKQVFINLLKNSIEAMPGGGNIHFHIGRREEGLFIRITDEGIGIPPEKLSKLGEPFYTTKDTGTGLGLNVCFRIVEAHMGKMHISSKPNEGTTVEIVLPFA